LLVGAGLLAAEAAVGAVELAAVLAVAAADDGLADVAAAEGGAADDDVDPDAVVVLEPELCRRRA
jgi:hypothetical protein